MVSFRVPLNTFVFVSLMKLRTEHFSLNIPGLQTQPSVNPPYAGPWDAVRKITGQHGIAGLFKGQTATFAREAIGYGAYFWAYETLMQREMKRTGKSRDEIPATKTVLFGAAAGYAVSFCSFPSSEIVKCVHVVCLSYGHVYTL